MAKPDDDRGAAGGDGRRGEVRAGARRRQRLRPAEPPARSERDRADAAPPGARALQHDQAAAVGGDARVDGAVRGARAHERPRGPEGRARGRGAPAHAAQGVRVGARARADHEGPAVASDREGGGDVARRDDLGGAGGRGGDEHQRQGPATRARRLHAWGTHRAARRLRPAVAARRAPSSSVACAFVHTPRVLRSTTPRAARGVVAQMHLTDAFPRPPRPLAAERVAEGARSQEDHRARGRRPAPRTAATPFPR